MREQAILILQQSIPIFLTLILLFIFYIICTMLIENMIVLENLFFFLVLFIILPDLLRIFEIVAQTVSTLTTTLYSFIPVISSTRHRGNFCVESIHINNCATYFVYNRKYIYSGFSNCSFFRYLDAGDTLNSVF